MFPYFFTRAVNRVFSGFVVLISDKQYNRRALSEEHPARWMAVYCWDTQKMSCYDIAWTTGA